VFYFSGCHCLLFALIGSLTSLDITEPVDCQALYAFNQVRRNPAIGLASVILSLRIIMVGSESRVIVCLLVEVMLGHWSF
ncbi:hypothetical protein EDD17DRAFT_1436584, partial [Pisolithus thermaeus]